MTLPVGPSLQIDVKAPQLAFSDGLTWLSSKIG